MTILHPKTPKEFYHYLKLLKNIFIEQEVFYKKTITKNFKIFTEETCVVASFLIKNPGLQLCNFIKTRLQHRCFPVNIAKFLKTPILKNICERLSERFRT